MVSEPRPTALRLLEGGANQRVAGEAFDEELLSSIREGSTAAAAAFHDRFRPIVDRTLMRLVGGRDPDYDDLAQRALMDLVSSIDRFRGACPVDAWASVVVARVVFKHIRRRKIERRIFALEAEVPEVVDGSSMSSIMNRAALRRIQRHLDALDRNKAWTFLLHDVHGYELDEISAITGVSRAAAQSRLVRGRRLIHERIALDPELKPLLDEFARRRRP